MRIIVAVIVYNRLENLKRWIRCWNESKPNAELYIIHTGPDDWSEHVKGVNYIRRENKGFDIGSFQDVCRGRLNGFPNAWDYLLWCTDDTIPMTKDFVTPFIDSLQNPKIGISCMQISQSVSPHVRTTGFCIKQEVASKLRFPADPVITKQQCYLFEHRGGRDTLTNQVRAMGYDCVMVSPAPSSPLWDMGYWRRLDRIDEHYRVFPSGKKESNKVTFICTIFNTYPQIISSLLLQTHKNWELILIHDGPSSNGMKSYIPKDERIKYIETKERKGNWGHYNRQWALEEIRQGRLSPDAEYIVVTNADNYYVPDFIKYSLHHIGLKHTTVATYSSKIVHSYISFGIMECRFERGFIDCGGVMIKKDIACEVGWRDVESHSSDWTFFSDIAAKYSPSNFARVPGCLFVHN